MRPVRPVWLFQRMKVPPSSSHTYTPLRWQWITVNVKAASCSQGSSLCFWTLLQRTAPGRLKKPLEKGNRATKMPASICGNWEMVSNANMEGYMIALGKFPACYTCIGLGLGLGYFCMMHCQKKTKHDYTAVLLGDGDPHCSSQTISLQVLNLTWERLPWSWRWGKWLSRRETSVSSKPAAPFGTTPSPSEWDRTLRSSQTASTTGTSRWPNKNIFTRGNSSVTCFIPPRRLQVLCVLFSGLATVTGDMAGKQAGVRADWREEEPRLGSLDRRRQVDSGTAVGDMTSWWQC